MKCRVPAGWLTFPAKRADEPSPLLNRSPCDLYKVVQ